MFCELRPDLVSTVNTMHMHVFKYNLLQAGLLEVSSSGSGTTGLVQI